MTIPTSAAMAAAPFQPRPGVWRGLRNGAIYLLVFLLSCVAIRRCLPFPEVPVVRDKLEHLAKHGDDYDVLFLGSSRVYFQIMPALFDRVAAENGLPVRSFNAGVSAMMPPEDGYLLEQILQRPHRRLRWVFIECMPVSGASDRTLAGTRRASYWHDWPRTRLLAKRFRQEWGADGQALTRWMENLKLFAENMTNLGSGGVLMTRWMGTAKMKKTLLPRRHAVGDGWLAPPGEQRMTGRVLEDYELGFTRLQQTEQRFSDGDPVSEKALHRMLETLAKNGVTPVLVIPPTVLPTRYRPAQPAPMLDFSDLREFPEFFMVEHRLDGVHLNAAGSELFTRALARRFVEKFRESASAL